MANPYTENRNTMVKEQIVRRGVKNPAVLQAMRKVPRHEFVPQESRALSYADHPLPIGKGQTISQPYIVAYMTEILELESTHRVLEIGSGCGYQTAVLAEIAAEVYTMEIVPFLAEMAQKNLQNYANVHFIEKDGFSGWPQYAPFDRIIITCAPPQVPQPLIQQLKIGGMMVVPEGTYIQSLKRIVRLTESDVREEHMLDVRFVPMVGQAEMQR
ncbi:protein-L-isoaspartate(D-aspartate) O-methyltransferase [Candidatus Uabimicrobium amorphum]|uniref:Protein-L-isoaspartate O-methyltransferase n=1 Tax=Uabimicrobium amorphum TaxID=2596890 RepID=A0A5S9F6D2_UABAM|nr:protein-L-isoaspartate(D-aspartate) O-methyltransferase [Candidatus Uabimicrobium amorphum]BBM86494.1 protein-L-isoaspartate O-methyltransferase [Candidatus Uabimicrobium amorphum]